MNSSWLSIPSTIRAAGKSRKLPSFRILLLVLAFFPAGLVSAKSTSVTVHLPVPQKIDLEGIRKVLVTDFSVEREDPTMDVGLEINRLIRRELAKYTSLEILDMVPPSIPEQAMADLLQNRSFWRQLARANDADLIITGGIEFDVTDRSGFVEETGVSPTTGQRVRSTRFRERQGYRLGLDLAFIHGLSGDVLYENRFIEEITIDGKSSDHLSILFRMFERIRPEVLAVVAPQKKTEERVLLSY